jgi:hypothetical protein
MGMVDPVLQTLVDAFQAGTLPPDPDNPEFLTYVYVVAQGGDFGGISAAGFDVASELDGIATVTLPIADIETLAGHGDVIALFAPQSGTPSDGEAQAFTAEQAAIGLSEAYALTSHSRPSGTHGEDVFVGVIDSGVNVLHDAFTFSVVEAGKTVRKTRILAYWAQKSGVRRGTTPVWERSGTVFTEAQINAFIAAFDASRTLPPAAVLDLESNGIDSGHGTGTASVAAGSSWPGTPEIQGKRAGIAPAATLIVVGGQLDDIAGIEFCFTKSGAKPCVINMSLNTDEMPHNGLSLFSHRLWGLLTQGSPRTFRPGRVYVSSAGNSGKFHNHMQLPLAQPKLLEIAIDPREISFKMLVSTSRPSLTVSLAPPGRVRRFTTPGPFAGKQTKADHEITIGRVPSLPQQSPDDLPDDHHLHILVRASRVFNGTADFYLRPGAWQVKLDPGGETHPQVDLWVVTHDEQKLDDPDFELGWATEDEVDGMPLRWRRRKEWIETTVGPEPGTIAAIAVGASRFDSTTAAMTPQRFSSRGPTTDAGRAANDTKPDIVAPGREIVVARWRNPARARDVPSGSARESGTSFASPCVAGTVALMLSHDPTLTQDNVRTILRSTTTPWAQAVRADYFVSMKIDETNIAGAGMLNILAALKVVKARVGP